MPRYGLILVLGLMLGACAPRPTVGPANPPAGTPSSLSAGCFASPPGTPPSTVRVGGLERGLITVVPPGYSSARPLDLVVAFHGRTNSNAQARAYFFLEEALDDTLIVYPSGLRNGSSFTWSDPGDPPEALRDYALFDEIVRQMAASYCLDLTRVFVVGHSLGAWFANSLACARGGVIRGVASLAGGMSSSSCSGHAAALILHNPNDTLVPIAEGERARDSFIRLNGASLGDVPVPGSPLEPFRCRWHSDAHDPVVWCPHRFDYRYDGSYYPHTWPEATSEAIAYFFVTLP